MSKNPVVHFEMPYKDQKRVADFYSKAFGWNMNVMGQDMGGYVVAKTSETDENNIVKTPGTINGGFYDVSRVPNKEDQTVHVIISVDDIKKAMEDVKAAGGTIKGEPMEVPGIGQYVSILDSERNAVGILQPNKREYQEKVQS